VARLAPTANAASRHGIGDGRRSREETRLLARGAHRVKGQMGARPRQLEPVPTSTESVGCASPGCRLPAQRCELCAHCAAVKPAAAELYDQLSAREMARLELDHPGLEHAARIALRTAQRRTPATAAATRRDLSIARSAGRGPLREWQIARLEQFVGQLRTLTSDAGGPE
jgi:hypothetical protein